MSDFLERATDIAVALTKGAIALTLLEELAELAEDHAIKKRQIDAEYVDRMAHHNARFVNDMQACVTRARRALDDINDDAAIHDADDD